MSVWTVETPQGALYAVFATREIAEDYASPGDLVVKRMVIGA